MGQIRTHAPQQKQLTPHGLRCCTTSPVLRARRWRIAESDSDEVAPGARGQLRWILHSPPAALRLRQNWSASSADANGPVMAR